MTEIEKNDKLQTKPVIINDCFKVILAELTRIGRMVDLIFKPFPSQAPSVIVIAHNKAQNHVGVVDFSPSGLQISKSFYS